MDKSVQIMQEFGVLFKYDRQALHDRYTSLMGNLQVHFKMDDSDELAILLRLQRSLAWNTAKKKLKQCLTVVDALDQDSDSGHKDPPRIIIMKHEDGSVQGVIVADTIKIDCQQSTTVFDLLLNFEACYYAWDLSFPTTYQLLAFLHCHVLQDSSESVFKESTFVKLEKALKL